jgi:hypothetical protein
MASTLPSAQDCCSPCGSTDDLIVGSSFGFFVVDDIAALRALDDSALNRFAEVSTGPVTVGSYVWSPTSGAADNGTTIIKPDVSTSNGRWLKVQ